MTIFPDDNYPHRKRGHDFITRNIMDYHDELLNPAIEALCLNPQDRKHLRILTEDKRPSPYLPMSNRMVRMMAWRCLANALEPFFTELVATGIMPRFWFLTFCWDDGFTFANNPELNVAIMRQKVRNALFEINLNGLTALEIHPFRAKWDGEASRRLCGHFHSIVWSYDPYFDPAHVEERMQKRFPNVLGAKGFMFSNRAQYVQKQLQAGRIVINPCADMTLEDLIYLAAYVLKAPNAMKRIVKTKDNPTKKSLKTTSDSYSGKLALQTAQFWSYLSPFDTVFGTGEGAQVRKVYAQQLRDFEKRNRRPDGRLRSDIDVFGVWQNIAALNSRKGLGKSRIIR